MANVSECFKATIKKHLDEIAQVDDSFAEAYEHDEKKSLDECCQFIISMAKKEGCSGYADDEVYGWAIHYYVEKEVKFDKVECQKVVVNHHVELTEEEKEEARQKALWLELQT